MSIDTERAAGVFSDDTALTTELAAELAAEGARRIAWARANMPVLRGLEQEYRESQPLARKRVTVCVHLEAKTAYLALVLQTAGAEVRVCGSNALSTNDSAVASLRASGLSVFAHRGCTRQELHEYMRQALAHRPHIVIDDGGDLVEILHDHCDLASALIGVCEETTTGVERARLRETNGALRFPVLAINDARCKYLFDNVHGTGQSVWDAIMRTTNVAVCGKKVVVVGFGWCGRGCAERARGLGARVTICEVDPVKALDAAMAGYAVEPLLAACEGAEIVLTVSGAADVLGREQFARLPDGAILANGGHFAHEIAREALQAGSESCLRVRENIEGFRQSDGRTLYLLGRGEIVNIACGDGHPAEIMDTSFALQALSACHLAQNPALHPAGLHRVPRSIDERVAREKLAAMGLGIDEPKAPFRHEPQDA